MGGSKIKMIIIMQTIIAAMALPCLAGEKVSFLQKTAKPPIFKIDCHKIQGKNDAFPTYTCFDKEGYAEKFDPGKEWEEVTVEAICYRHSVRENIRVCLKIQGKQDKTEHYGCVDAKGDLIPFAPDQNIWEKLAADNPDCKPHIIKMDIPRGTISLENDESDRSDSGEQGK